MRTGIVRNISVRRAFFSFRCVLLCCLCLISKNALSGDGVASINITQHFKSSRIEYQSPSDKNKYTAVAEAIVTGKHDRVFTHPPETTGLLVHEALWYKATLPAGMLAGDRWVLEIPYALSSVKMWYAGNNGIATPLQSGAAIDPETRKKKTATPSFTLPDNVHQDIHLVVRIVGVPVLFKALLWNQEAWNEHQHHLLVWYGIIFGVVGALLLYNLFLSIALKEISYFYYVLYLSFMALLVMDISGSQALYTTFQEASLTWLSLASAFGLAFCNRFLGMRALSPVFWWFSIFVIVADVFIGMQVYLPITVIPSPYILLGVLSFSGIAVVYYLIAPIYAYFKGMRPARFLIVAFAVITGAFYLYISKLLGADFPDMPTHRIVEIAIISEALLLSLALADRINLLNSAKESAEKQAMNSQKLFSRLFVHAQEVEREHFSNTLHDAIGHGLLVLKQNLHTLASNDALPDSEREQTESLIGQCREILEDVRDLSHDLHPHILRRLGLKDAIESTMEKALSSQEIDWVAKITIAEDRLQEEQKIALYRIVQEALNNILKHANAREVILTIHGSAYEIAMQIKDDGSGVPPGKNIEKGIGFTTMKGRVQLLGGWMKMKSSAAHGTKLQFGMPLK